jgi:hypothetical protein
VSDSHWLQLKIRALFDSLLAFVDIRAMATLYVHSGEVLHRPFICILFCSESKIFPISSEKFGQLWVESAHKRIQSISGKILACSRISLHNR